MPTLTYRFSGLPLYSAKRQHDHVRSEGIDGEAEILVNGEQWIIGDISLDGYASVNPKVTGFSETIPLPKDHPLYPIIEAALVKHCFRDIEEATVLHMNLEAT